MSFLIECDLKEVLKGLGQIIDIRGSYTYDIENKYLNTPSNILDSNAIKSDWLQVGNDIRSGMAEYDQKQSKQ